VEETNDMYLDVFSCKTFEEDTVKKLVSEYFKPEQMDTKLVVRDASQQMK
jgi:hypothetical protein